jgi:hypothetical protein
MSQVDQIRKVEIIETPETVNTDWSSPSWSLDDRFGEFSLQIKYINGSTPDVRIYLQVCNTNEDADFATIIETEAIVTDNSGTIVYDLNGSGVSFMRVRIVVNSGSIDVARIFYVAQQAH